jgi:putative SOS response-associated peptidase YedK
MCGRYRRLSDKQRIAEVFHVGMDLEDIYLEPEYDIAPGSVQPVVFTGESGEHEIALMRVQNALTKQRSGRTHFNSAVASSLPTPFLNGRRSNREGRNPSTRL